MPHTLTSVKQTGDIMGKISGNDQRFLCKQFQSLILIAAVILQGEVATAQSPGRVISTFEESGSMESVYSAQAIDGNGGESQPDWWLTTPAESGIYIDSEFSTQILDFQNRQTDKQLLLLDHAATSNVSGATIVPGIQLRASFLAAATNEESRFPYLGRFPTDFNGRTATDARLLHGNVSAATHFGSWAHGYFETLFSDVFTFPTFQQGSFQVRQAYVVVGNLNVSPFYMFLGKKNVGFGDMGTMNPFSQAMNWHYFSALHEGIGGGYYCRGIHANLTALNGGRGIRVADSGSTGQLNNFAANFSVTRNISPMAIARLGCGYLHGTIYDSATAEHIDNGLFGNRNPAWDINARVQSGCVFMAAELTRTFEPWPVTGSKVTAYRVESGIDGYLRGVPTQLTMGWSEGIQGPRGSEYEYNRQLVLGCGMRLNTNTLLTMEYVQSTGFAPLINITRASDRSVRQHSAVFGLVLTL